MALAAQGRQFERPFVGREAELRVLTHALALDGHSHGSFVLIRGEPGIGKSALIASALSRVDAASGPVLRATADAMDQRRPYGLLLNALASGDAESRQRVAALAERQREIAAVDFARTEVTVGEHVLDLIDVMAARGPFTMVLEDLQWADAGSLAVLTRLSRSLHQQPIVIVCSKRPLPRSSGLDDLIADVEARHLLTTIELGPLPSQACAALTEAVTRARVDDDLLRQLDAAGGNPLFLIELLGVIQRDGSLTVASDGRARLSSMPVRAPSLALMIMNHLGSLSAPARDLLVLASVLGARFPIADLRLIARHPVTELLPALTEVMAAGVLGEDGASTLTFRHALIQEVLIADVPPTIRGELHHEIATRLDAAGAPPVAVAEHLLRAPASAELVPWTLELAERVRTISPETAVELWSHVIEASRPMEDAHIRAASGMARAIMVGGRTAEAAEIARAALDGGAPADLEGALRSTLSHALLLSGDYIGAQAEADRAAQSPRLSPAERAEHLAFSGWPRLLLGETGEALACAREAEAAAVASGNDSARILAMVLRGHIAACRGDLAEAFEALNEAVDISDAEHTVAAIEPFPHQIAATLFADIDRVPESLALFERGRRLAERLGYLPGVFSAFYLCSRARALSGHLSDVEADLEARDSLRGRLDVHMEATTLGTRAWVALHRDGPDAAEPWIRRLGDIEATTGLARGIAWVHGTASAQARAMGDSRRAFRILWSGWERCLSREVLLDCVQMAVQLAALAVELGELECAEQVEQVVTEVAERNPDVVHLAATALLVQGLARGDSDLLQEGAELMAATPRRMQHAQGAELAASALARDGRLEEATVLAQAALRSYRDIGADHDVDHARARLGSIGIRLKGARMVARPVSGWGALTKTEETVARQVATGLSNPEVAEVLFVSRRTVESHVSHVLAKLGLRSRTELVLLVARRANELDERGHEVEPAPKGRRHSPSRHGDAAGRRAGLVERDLDEHASP
ncbi:AAA family ATPase [Knoellia sp. S7-12]|uniref:ATP-binding protein n=1 Tax=Knoellia sp. S7-12 TaxID=3126698 RepID=UPI003366D636